MLIKVHLSVQALFTKLIKACLKVNNPVNQTTELSTKLPTAQFDKFVSCFGNMWT